METIVGVHTKSISSEGDENHLKNENDAHYKHKQPIVEKSIEHIHFVMNFAGVDEIEDLHHDKGVKNEGEVPGVVVCGLQNGLVVGFPIDLYIPAGSGHVICCVLVVGLEISDVVKIISVFWDDVLACEHQGD